MKVSDINCLASTHCLSPTVIMPNFYFAQIIPTVIIPIRGVLSYILYYY